MSSAFLIFSSVILIYWLERTLWASANQITVLVLVIIITVTATLVAIVVIFPHYSSSLHARYTQPLFAPLSLLAWRTKQSINPRHFSITTSGAFLRLTSFILFVVIDASLTRISHYFTPPQLVSIFLNFHTYCSDEKSSSSLHTIIINLITPTTKRRIISKHIIFHPCISCDSP